MNKLTLILTPTLILAAAGVLGAQTVTVNPTSLSFSALVGGSVQSAQLAVSTSNGGPVIAEQQLVLAQGEYIQQREHVHAGDPDHHRGSDRPSRQHLHRHRSR